MLFITAIISSRLSNPLETLGNELWVKKANISQSLNNYMDIWNKGRKRGENEEWKNKDGERVRSNNT